MLAQLVLTLAAQVPDPITPESIDVSGVWVVEPKTVAREREVRRCDQQYFAEGNFAIYGGNTVELRQAGPARLDPPLERGQRRIVVVPYEGVLHHLQGYGARSMLEPNRFVYDYFCHVEPIDYRLSGELRIDELGPTLSLSGPPVSPPRYEHAPIGRVGGGFKPNFPGAPIPVLWIDLTGDVLYGSTSVGVAADGARVNRGVLPGGCDIFLTNPASVVELTRCEVRELEPMRLRRVGAAGDEVKLPLRGELIEGLPDGTRTSSKVNLARVRVYEQDQVIRARGGGESEADYANYLAARRAGRRLVEELSPSRDGSFVTRPLSARIGAGKLYTIEVVDAEKWEELETPGVFDARVVFAPKVLENADQRQPYELVLIPDTVLQAKLALATALAAKAPHAYGPIERAVASEVRPFLQNPGPTPAQLEGVSRALWAERGAAAGFEYVGPMLDAMLAPLGELAGELLAAKALSQDKALKDARERLMNLQEARIADVLGGGAGRSSRSEIDRAIERLVLEDSRLFHENLLKQTKLAMLGLMASIKSGLVRAGLPLDRADAIHDLLKDFVFALAEAVAGNDPSELLKTLVKQLTQLAKDPLIDNPTDASYAGLTASSLAFARDERRAWSTDDRAAWSRDRQRTVAEIAALHDHLLFIQYGLFALEALSEWSDSTNDVFELVPHPWFQSIAKIAKITHYVSDGARVVDGFITVFVVLPLRVDRVAYAAFGRERPARLIARATAPTAPTNARLWQELVAAASAHDPTLDTTRRRAESLGFDELVEAANDGTDPLGALARFDEAFARFRAEARAVEPPDERLSQALLLSEARYLELRARVGLASWELSSWLLGVYAGPYTARSDAALVRDRRRLTAALVSARAALDALELGVLGANYETLRAKPALRVARLELASRVTGAQVVRARPERFALTAVIEGVGTSSVGSARARLVVHDRAGAVMVGGALERPIGAIDGDDGAPGGPDTATLEWDVEWRGELLGLADPVFELQILEGGGAPSGFFALSDLAVLSVDRAISDADSDGMHDGYERAHGLDPSVDDAALDLDGDGLSNGEEVRRGTAPERADTDGDGLSDGEERETDPSRADTDGDGTDDRADGAPLDGTTSVAGAPRDPPAIALERALVHLPSRDGAAVVEVRATGDSTVSWTVRPESAAYLEVSPTAPAITRGPGTIVLRQPEALRPDFYEGRPGPAPVVLEVVELNGARRSHRLEVVFGRDAPDAGPLSSGDAAPAPGEDAGPTAGRDAGSAGPPDPAESGCACRTRGGDGGGALLALALLALGSRRRR